MQRHTATELGLLQCEMDTEITRIPEREETMWNKTPDVEDAILTKMSAVKGSITTSSKITKQKSFIKKQPCLSKQVGEHTVPMVKTRC